MPKRQAERQAKGLPLYDERSVACPLRFWGFRHIMEVPPQQVEDEDSTGHEKTTRIPADCDLTGTNATETMK